MEDDTYENIFPLPMWFRLLILFMAVLLPACASVPQPAVEVQKPALTLYAEFSGPKGDAKLYNERCTKASVLSYLTPELQAVMREAWGTYEGKEYDLCWTQHPDGDSVVLVWEDGGLGRMSHQLLKRALGV